MKYNLLHIFKEELLEEAKRLVPLCYDEKDLFKCSFEKLKKELNPKYKEFEIHFHLMLPYLCFLKEEDKDFLEEKIELSKMIDHNLKLIDWKIKIDKCDIRDIVGLIVDDIIKNNYSDESIYTLIPKLARKYMKCHHDSVDWECIVMLLEEKLNNKGYNLLSSNFSDLKKIA